MRDVGGDLLVYDAAGARTHVLNPTARAIWEACDGARSVSQLTSDLALRFSVDPGQIDGDVNDALQQFADVGLLVDPEVDADPAPADSDPPHDAAEHEQTLPRVALDQLPETSAVFDIAGSALRYHAAHADLIDYLNTVLASMQIPEADVVAQLVEDVSIDWSGVEGDSGAIWLGDVLVGRPSSARSVASVLLWDINRVAIRSDERLSFHAGAVAHPDGIVLLPASPDSGKSTLTLGLVRGGWGYLGDEAFGIELHDRRVVPYLKPLTLDPGSWEVFPDLEPHVPEPQQQYLHDKWHVDMRAVGGGIPPDARGFVLSDVTTVVFPTYREGADTEIEELTPSAVAVALAENAFNLAKGGDAAVEVLADLAVQVRGFRLVHGGSEAAVAAVRELVENPPAG